MLKNILSKEVQEFIIAHADDDPSDLLLRFHKKELSFPLNVAVEQIISRNKAFSF